MLAHPCVRPRRDSKRLFAPPTFFDVITPSPAFAHLPRRPRHPCSSRGLYSKQPHPKLCHTFTSILLAGFSKFRASRPSPHRPVNRPACTLWSIICFYWIFEYWRRATAPLPDQSQTPRRKQTSKHAREPVTVTTCEASVRGPKQARSSAKSESEVRPSAKIPSVRVGAIQATPVKLLRPRIKEQSI